MKQAIHLGKKQVGVAIALALGLAVPAAAFAAGMPGAGTVTLGAITAPSGTNNNGLKTITGLANGATLTATKATVIQWGGAGAPTDTKNAGGFNVLAGNTLTFAGAFPVLNVDDSGNTSIIAGQVTAANNLFIANANGVTVTPGGTISAPVVGLIGANFATTATKGTNANGLGNLIAPTSGPQFAFAGGTAMNIAFASGGDMTIAGTINNGAGKAAQILIAGSGSVNVNATGFDYSGSALDVRGGTGFQVDNTGAITAVVGNKTSGIPAANAYAATNVSLTNAAPTSVFADGNLTFSGYSTLPASTKAAPKFGWTGTLENTSGSTLFTPSAIGGSGATAGVNPWFGTVNPLGGYVATPVGSIVNNGLLQTVTTGLTTVSNGFTNTGTLRIGTGGGLTVTSDTGDINLGGTVQGSSSSPAISFANLTTTKAGTGNINVSAPLTISGTGAKAAAGSSGTFYAMAQTGNVSISGALTLTATQNASAAVLYKLMGNNISTSANQTISNSTAANSTQPDAWLDLNNTSAGTVTIGAGSTLTAGDVWVSGAKANNPLVNLVADGNITATNTKDAANFGKFTFAGNSISGAGAGTITAQVFNIDATGNIRKSVSGLSNNFWTNGLVLTSAGADPTLNLSVTGPGKQFVNLRVAGNITVNSGDAKLPLFSAPNLSGTGGAGETNTNVMSQMMLMATGNMVIGGADTAGATVAPGVAPGQFYFPGLTYFGNISGLTTPNGIGAGSITTTGDVNNSIAVPVGGGQGLYFMTNNLTIGGSLYTNMKSYVNFGTAAQSAQYANSEYAVSYSSIYTNTLNMAPPASPIGNVYTIPAN